MLSGNTGRLLGIAFLFSMLSSFVVMIASPRPAHSFWHSATCSGGLCELGVSSPGGDDLSDSLGGDFDGDRADVDRSDSPAVVFDGTAGTCAGSFVAAREGGGYCVTVGADDEEGAADASVSASQAAAELVRTFTLLPIDIGMVPQFNPDLGLRRSYVGVPIWLWAAAQDDQNWGPRVVTADLYGYQITAHAQVESVRWDLGDGVVLTCGAGTPYQAEYLVSDSPSCGHRYIRTSIDQPDGRYTVTATSNWVVSWQASNGESGIITTSTETLTQVQVLELQAVNVPAS